MQPVIISEGKVSEIKAKQLASELSLEFKSLIEVQNIDQMTALDLYFIVQGESQLYLRKGLKKNDIPIFCNFHYWSTISPKSNLLKCMKGLSKECSVIDTTAGFGRDALELAKVSGSVTLIEKVKWMWALLDDGLKFFSEKNGLLSDKLTLLYGDSNKYLKNHQLSADVIYLDPMFPNMGSAKAKKNIQALRELTVEENPDLLFQNAIKQAKNRVIVKRHRNSGFLGTKKPAYSVEGRVVRFDVYLI